MGLFQKESSQATNDYSWRDEKGSSSPEYEEDIERSPSGHEEVDPELARRVVRKFDRHLIPWLFVFWLLAFIDRSNIGNAKIAGLKEEAAPEGTQFNIALAIFYVPYIIVDVPSNWVLKYFKAGRYLPFLITAWGLTSTFTGFVKDYGGLLAVRFFLGLCEGGLLGGMILYLSMFYRRHQMLYRIGLFYCAAPLAGAFGGLLAAGLGEIEVSGYVSWPWIFFVEGAITVVVGIISFFFLPHTPQESRFLTEEERRAAVALMLNDMAMSKQPTVGGAKAAASKSGTPTVDPTKFSWHWVRLALFNVNTQLLSLNFFAIITPIYSYSLFLPTIIRNLNYSVIISQLLSVPPNMGGFFAVLLIAHLSDRYKRRGIFMIGGAALAIVGYIMLLASTAPLTQYGGTFLVAAGIFPCSPLVMGWLSNNLTPHYVRATGTGYEIGVANLAAFIATFTYLDEDAPRYVSGHSINIGVLVLSLCLSGVLLVYQKRENGRRDRGERRGRLEGLSAEEEVMLGHRHPDFRYTL